MPHKTLQNVGVTYNALNLIPYLNQASLQATVQAVDTTNLGSTGQEQSPGAPSFSVPVGGYWAKELDDVLGPDAISPPTTQRTLVVSFGPSGSKVIFTWTGGTYTGAFISDYQIQASDPLGQLTWSGTLTCSGAPARTTG
jgi:hypothetical protein